MGFRVALGCPASQVATLHCFKDMTARDLLQRRATDAAGDTRWEPSPLLRAARRGALLVLDGLHRLKPEVLASLAALLQDGSTQLFDGERLLRADQFARAARAGVATKVVAAAVDSGAGAGLKSTSKKSTDQLRREVRAKVEAKACQAGGIASNHCIQRGDLLGAARQRWD